MTDQRTATSRRNARYGLWLFFSYLALYAGFMGLSAFSPEAMKSAPFGGTNLAIWYGLGLIVAALALALLYMAMCRQDHAHDRAPNAAPSRAEGDK